MSMTIGIFLSLISQLGVAVAEQTVQVPVSLIELAAAQLEALGAVVVPRRLHALLSQPTPTAEPPSIEDMAPGTTFVEEVRWTVTGTLSTGLTVTHSESGEMRFADRFDPSTIRDVTQPKDAA